MKVKLKQILERVQDYLDDDRFIHHHYITKEYKKEQEDIRKVCSEEYPCAGVCDYETIERKKVRGK